MIYVGVGVGSFVQSWADEYGRLAFIKWNAVLQTVFGLLSCMSTSIGYFIFFRFVYGIGIGIVLPISATYISEITTTESRTLWPDRGYIGHVDASSLSYSAGGCCEPTTGELCSSASACRAHSP